MDKIIKILKIVFLVIAILIGLLVLGGAFFIYKGAKTGDLTGFVTKTAIENTDIGDKLTEEQKQMLESGDYEALAEDVGENLTPEQIECAVEVLGPARAAELEKTMDPTPQEVFKLSKCL